MELVRSRRWYVVAAVATFVIGVASRVSAIGWIVIDQYLGDALYAVLLYLVICLAVPRWSLALRVGLAATLMLLIELFQLTGIAGGWRDGDEAALKLLSVALGIGFRWWDLLAYALGLAAIVAVEQLAPPRAASV